MQTKELPEELHKPIVRKSEKRKLHSSFINNIWGADLANMQAINKFDKGFWFFSFDIDMYSKYVWVIHLKHRKGITFTVDSWNHD